MWLHINTLRSKAAIDALVTPHDIVTKYDLEKGDPNDQNEPKRDPKLYQNGKPFLVILKLKLYRYTAEHEIKAEIWIEKMIYSKINRWWCHECDDCLTFESMSL